MVSICANIPDSPLTKLYEFSVHTQSHIHRGSDSPYASIATPTANRAHLGPLDLAPSRITQKSPPLSPCSSPRRPPLPLTPPLTPSSLNDGASQGGLPATPTDLDPTSAALWRRKSKYHPQKGLLFSDSDELIADITPTDRPYTSSTQSQQPESKSPLSRYLRLDSLPSRILLVRYVVDTYLVLNLIFCPQISNVPKTVTNEGIKTAFAPYGASKGIWTGHLQSLGIVILAFHDLRHAENACRAVRSGKAHIVLGGVLRAIQLHSGFISVAEARDVCVIMISLIYRPLSTHCHSSPEVPLP